MTPIRSFLLLLLAGSLLAGCAGIDRASAPATPSPTPEAREWEERIVRAPWFVSAEYFRQRSAQQQPVLDIPQLRRSREELEAKQKQLEERLAKVETRPGIAAGHLGYVVRVSGARIYTDMTSREGAAPGVTLTIFGERELKHPVTGQLLGITLEEIGRARVVEVGDAFSVAEVVELHQGETVKSKDRVTIKRAP